MRGYRAIALTASVSVFMQFLDSTALNTAIPAIARDLHVHPIDMNIVILAYQLTMVVFMPLANMIAGRMGPRNAFILSLAVFTVGAILSALSPTLPALVAARSLQGLAGALLIPVSRILVISSAAKSELVSAMNWLLIPGIIGPLAGPAVGGLLVTYASWHAIFLVNVPIALLGIVMALILVPDLRSEAPDRFDRKGMALLTPVIVGLVLGLGGAVGSQAIWVTGALLAMSLVFGIAYVRHARRAPAPILDLSFLAVPTFRHSIISGSLMRIIFGAVGFLLPLWFQLAMHFEPARTGILMTTMSIGALTSRFIGQPLIRYFHPRNVAIYGALGLALVLLAVATLQPDWPMPIFYLLLIAEGMMLSISLLVINPVAYVELPPERIPAAASAYTLIQQLSFSLGIVLGVWTITAMRWLTAATPADGRAYSGSVVMLGLLALWGMLVASKVDADAAATLRPAAKAASA